MGREIKVRAWDKRQKQMSKVFTIPDLTQYEHIFERMFVNLARFDDLVWLEWTGLKDKNGKEIYEGDILSYQGLDVNKKIYECRYEVRFGEYDNGEHYDDNVSGYGWWLLERIMLRDGKLESYESQVYDYRGLHGLGNMEVIGNIYENPELLES